MLHSNARGEKKSPWNECPPASGILVYHCHLPGPTIIGLSFFSVFKIYSGVGSHCHLSPACYIRIWLTISTPTSHGGYYGISIYIVNYSYDKTFLTPFKKLLFKHSFVLCSFVSMNWPAIKYYTHFPRSSCHIDGNSGTSSTGPFTLHYTTPQRINNQAKTHQNRNSR